MARLALSHPINFKDNPENLILRLIFSVIQSQEWGKHDFKISFKAKKNDSGKGFQVREMKISSPSYKKIKYKSPLDKLLPLPKKIKAAIPNDAIEECEASEVDE